MVGNGRLQASADMGRVPENVNVFIYSEIGGRQSGARLVGINQLLAAPADRIVRCARLLAGTGRSQGTRPGGRRLDG
jgi:hypothetical protein